MYQEKVALLEETIVEYSVHKSGKDFLKHKP